MTACNILFPRVRLLGERSARNDSGFPQKTPCVASVDEISPILSSHTPRIVAQKPAFICIEHDVDSQTRKCRSNDILLAVQFDALFVSLLPRPVQLHRDIGNFQQSWDLLMASIRAGQIMRIDASRFGRHFKLCRAQRNQFGDPMWMCQIRVLSSRMHPFNLPML